MIVAVAIAVFGLLVGAVTLRRHYLMVAVRGSSMAPTYADGKGS